MHKGQSEKESQEEVLQDPTMSISQSYALEQSREDFLLGKHDVSTDCDPPETTHKRQQASILGKSLDQDEYLPAKLSCAHDGDVTSTLDGQKSVLYLAYGSNLASATFLGMRGIRPLSQLGVIVPGLRLTFDLPGVPYIEPCFAGTHFRHDAVDDKADQGEEKDASEKHSLLKAERIDQDRYRGPLIGVVYEVTLSDYAKIIATEGGGRGYKDIVMTCYPFPDTYDPAEPIPEHPGTQPLKAHTLLSPAGMQELMRIKGEPSANVNIPRRPCCAQPSARYLNLITTGAAEHNLPLAYREYLAQLQPYRITSMRQRMGMVVFMMTWAPLIMTVLALSRIFARPDGRSPEWVGRLSDFVSTRMWSSYDNVFVHIFGDGEKTIER